MRFLPAAEIKILHVSDLHLNESDVSDDGKIEHLLWRQVGATGASNPPLGEQFDLCLVTGDLAKQSPSKVLYQRLAKAFEREFPAGEQGPPPAPDAATHDAAEGSDNAAPRRWIVIPGNHDRRSFGNFFGRFHLNRKSFDDAFDTWKRCWWDEKAPVVIIPLDSNPDRRAGRNPSYALPLARGCLGPESKRIKEEVRNVRAAVGKTFRAVLGRMKPDEVANTGSHFLAAFTPEEIDLFRQVSCPFIEETLVIPDRQLDRLREVLGDVWMARAAICVAMHHHPVGVADTENLGLTHQDAYLTLTDAGDFLKDARDAGISVVFHGHKHMPFRTVMALPGPSVERLGIVGCGSTTERGAGSTANHVTVSRHGEVTVRLQRVAGGLVEEGRTGLAVRDWPQVKAHLSAVCEQRALLSMESASIHVQILSGGDAIVTAEFKNVTFKEGARRGSQFEIPIAIEAPFYVPKPVIVVDERIGRAEVRELYATWGEWAGSVSFALEREHAVVPRVQVRYFVPCGFAMDPWQFWGMYPPQDGVPRATEEYRWQCSIPVRKRLAIMLGVEDDSENVFRGALRVHRAFEDDDSGEDPELQEMQFETSPTRNHLALFCRRPVWGSVYGLSWKWGVSSALRWSDSVERTRTMLLDCERSGDLRGKATAILQECTFGAELVLFVIGRRDGAASASLYPFAWNTAAEEAQLDDVELPIGVGVAGRAAWLRHDLAWVDSPEAQEGGEASWGDSYYLIPGTRRHGAVLAVPLIPDGQDMPLAVLSVADYPDSDFVTEVQVEIEGQGDPGRSDEPRAAPRTTWVTNAGERLMVLLQES